MECIWIFCTQYLLYLLESKESSQILDFKNKPTSMTVLPVGWPIIDLSIRGRRGRLLCWSWPTIQHVNIWPIKCPVIVAIISPGIERGKKYLAHCVMIYTVFLLTVHCCLQCRVTNSNDPEGLIIFYGSFFSPTCLL